MKKAEERSTTSTQKRDAQSNDSYVSNYTHNLMVAQEVQEANGLKIDPTFRDVIPKLTEDEFSQLEKNILADGRVKEPIVVWNGTIIDGHHRFYVVLMHPEIPYEIEERDFENEWAAKAWACANQLGRRNLNDAQKALLLTQEFDSRRMAQGSNNQYVQKKSEKDKKYLFHSKQPTTTEQMAKDEHIPEGTLKAQIEYGRGINKGEEVHPGFESAVINGTVKPTKRLVRKIRLADDETAKKAVDAIMDNNLSEAKGILNGEEPSAPEPESEPEPYNADDMAGEIQASSETMIETLEQILFISHPDISGNSDGKKKAQKELKSHITSIRDVINRLEKQEG